MAVTLRYFTEIWTYLGDSYVTVAEVTPILYGNVCDRNYNLKNPVFGNICIWFVVIFYKRLLRKNTLKTGTPHSTAKIRIVQYCAAMSAIAELLLLFVSYAVIGIGLLPDTIHEDTSQEKS